MIDKKIASALGYIDFIVSGPFSWRNYEEGKRRAAKALKSLFQEYAMEIIGEMEEENLPSPFSRARNIGAEYRNQLRAEQREKVGEI